MPLERCSTRASPALAAGRQCRRARYPWRRPAIPSLALALLLVLVVATPTLTTLVHESKGAPAIAVTGDDRAAAARVRGHDAVQEAAAEAEVAEAWAAISSISRDVARADAEVTAAASAAHRDRQVPAARAAENTDPIEGASLAKKPSGSGGRRHWLSLLLLFLHSPPLPPLLAPIPILFRLAASILAAPFALCVTLDVVAYLVARGLGLRFRDIRLPRPEEPTSTSGEAGGGKQDIGGGVSDGVKVAAGEQVEASRARSSSRHARRPEMQAHADGPLRSRSKSARRVAVRADDEAPHSALSPSFSPSPSPSPSLGFSPTPSPPQRPHADLAPRLSRESSEDLGLGEGEGLLPSEYSSTDEGEADEEDDARQLQQHSSATLVHEPEQFMSSSLLGLQLDRHATPTRSHRVDDERINDNVPAHSAAVLKGINDWSSGVRPDQGDVVVDTGDDDYDEDDENGPHGATLRRDTIRPGEYHQQGPAARESIELAPPIRA